MRRVMPLSKRGIGCACCLLLACGQSLPLVAQTARSGKQGPAAVVGKAGAQAIRAMAFSPDGSRIALGGYGSVTLRETATGRVVRRLEGSAGIVTALAFSPHGEILAAAGGRPGQSGEVCLWEMRTGKLLGTLTGAYDLIYGIAFRPDGRQLAGGSYDHLVSIWNLPISPSHLQPALQ